jgi:hypothetical protein
MYFFFTQRLQCTFYHSYDFQPVVAYTVLSRPMSFEVMATPSRVPPPARKQELAISQDVS